jgi:lipopolysaccharide transport system permease protein
VAPPNSSRPAGEDNAVGRVPAPPRTVIEAEIGWQPIDFRGLWHYRELLWFFAWRDVKVRYKQTELGIAWAVLEPLLLSSLFAVLFGGLSGGEALVEGIPNVLTIFAAMLPWQLFAESSARSSESLVTSQNLVTKVYFPRMILPLSAVATALVDFAVLFVVLIIMMGLFGIYPSWSILTLPVFVTLAVLASVSLGVWLSALSAVYRDFRYAQPMIIRLGLFASPVFYVTSFAGRNLPDWAAGIYALNPMVAVIEGFRWSLLPDADPPRLAFLPSVLMTLVLLVGGMYFFRRMERTIADVI